MEEKVKIDGICCKLVQLNQWVMGVRGQFAHDKLALPEGIRVGEDTLASLEYAIGLLPAEFEDSSVFWQLSGSAGVFDDGQPISIIGWISQSPTMY